MHEGLGAAIDVAAGIGICARDGAEAHDMAAVARDHAWKDGARDIEEALYVGIHHALPIRDRDLVGRLEAECQSGIVEEHIDRGKFGGQR